MTIGQLLERLGRRAQMGAEINIVPLPDDTDELDAIQPDPTGLTVQFIVDLDDFTLLEVI